MNLFFLGGISLHVSLLYRWIQASSLAALQTATIKSCEITEWTAEMVSTLVAAAHLSNQHFGIDPYVGLIDSFSCIWRNQIAAIGAMIPKR